MSENENRPFVPSLVPAGTMQYPRWRIADQCLRYWTGTEWTENENQGTMYASVNEAAMDLQKLLLEHHGKQKKQVFQAPVYLELYSDKEVSQAEVFNWLMRVARLIIDSPKHGNGPLQNTLGLVRIQWSEMKEVKNE